MNSLLKDCSLRQLRTKEPAEDVPTDGLGPLPSVVQYKITE